MVAMAPFHFPANLYKFVEIFMFWSFRAVDFVFNIGREAHFPTQKCTSHKMFAKLNKEGKKVKVAFFDDGI